MMDDALDAELEELLNDPVPTTRKRGMNSAEDTDSAGETFTLDTATISKQIKSETPETEISSSPLLEVKCEDYQPTVIDINTSLNPLRKLPGYESWLLRDAVVPNVFVCIPCNCKLTGNITHLKRHAVTNKHKKMFELQTLKKNRGQEVMDSNPFAYSINYTVDYNTDPIVVCNGVNNTAPNAPFTTVHNIPHKSVQTSITPKVFSRKTNYKTVNQLQNHTLSTSAFTQQTAVASLQLSAFVAQHYECLELLPQLLPMFQAVIKDSRILQHIQLDTKKATHIILNILAPHAVRQLAQLTVQHKFSLIIDETTESWSCQRILRVSIRVLHPSGQVKHRLLALIKLPKHADAIFIVEVILQCCRLGQLSMNNLIGFAADHSAVVRHQASPVQSLLTSQYPNIVFHQNMCHVLGGSMRNSCRQLSANVLNLIRLLSQHFCKDSKRSFIDLKFQKSYAALAKSGALKAPRWLALEEHISLLLQHWDSLSSYYHLNSDEEESSAVLQMLERNDYRLTVLFFSYFIGLLKKVTLEFKANATAHLFLPRSEYLLRTIARNFLNHVAMNNFSVGLNFQDPFQQVPAAQVYCGVKVQLYLESQQQLQCLEFFEDVRTFYGHFCAQLQTNIDFEHKIYKAAANLSPKLALSGTVPSILALAQLAGVDAEDVNSEWRSLPDTQECKGLAHLKYTEFWSAIFELRNDFGERAFPMLKVILDCVATLPTHCERMKKAAKDELVKGGKRERLPVATAAALAIFNDYLSVNEIQVLNWTPEQELVDKYNATDLG